MSDDRFKKARQDLIDGDDEEEAEEAEDDQDLSSAKTAMVDLNELEGGGDSGAAADDSGSRESRRSRESRGESGGRDNQSDRAPESAFDETGPADNFSESPTAAGTDPAGNSSDDRFDPSNRESDRSGGRGGGRRGSADDGSRTASGHGGGETGDGGGRRGNTGHGAGGRGGGERGNSRSQSNQGSNFREEATLDSGTHMEAVSDPGQQGDDQVFVPDGEEGGGGYEDAKTDFVDLNDFADAPDPADESGSGQGQVFSPDDGSNSAAGHGQTFSPGGDSSGYDGSTQFIDVNELQDDGGASNQDNAIVNDSILQQSYNFDGQDIEHGDATVIMADNPLGDPVLLRQVWSGDANNMPGEVRQRIQDMAALEIPGLISLNGMVITETGCWVEFDRPPGRRLDQLLQAKGPQPLDRVKEWIGKIGQTLQELHDHNYIYANLMPDAVWIDQSGNPYLEPFDVLALRDRGDLDDYGAPELRPDGNHEALSPGTDVYSLGALTIACLTGIPLNPEAIAQIDDDSVIDTIREAVLDDPKVRPDSAESYVEDLQRDELTLNDIRELAEEADFKVLAGGIVALGGIAFVVATMLQGGGGGGGQKQATKTKKADPSGSSAETAKASPTSPEAAEKKDRVVAEPPGNYHSDSRMKVETAYRFNPPDDASEKSGTEKKSRIEQLRKRADELREEAEKTPEERKPKAYRKAALALARLAELQDGSKAEETRKELDELYKKEPLQTYREEQVDKIRENLKANSFSEVSIALRDLEAIVPGGASKDFHKNVSEAAIVELESDSGDSDEEDED